MKPFVLFAVLALAFCACSTKPPCSASSCPGCCDSSGQCQSGFAQGACGQLGGSCDVCVGLQSCQLGRCSLPEGGGSGGGGAGGGSGGGAGGGGGVGGGGGSTSFGPCGARGECATGVCNRPTNLCVTCRSPVDCDRGFVCTNGACAAATACTSDLDCTPAGKVCDLAGSRCVQCKSSAECSSGQACVGFACTGVISCMSSLACATRKQVCAPAPRPGFPTTVGQACQDCSTRNDCPAGDDCQDGVCIDACGPNICGDVNGVSCGTCPGEGVTAFCADTGRACLTTVASSSTGSAGDSVAFVSGALMWTERFSGGSVYALSLSDGGLDTVAIGELYPEGVGATSTTFYWGAGSGVFQRARSGGGKSLAASLPTTHKCISLALAPGQIYCGVYAGGGSGEGVYRAPLGAAAALMSVVPETFPSVFNRGQNVFFVGAERIGFHDALAGTTVNLLTHNGTVSVPVFADDAAVYFWRGDGSPAVKRIDLATRMETLLYLAQGDEQALVAGISDGTQVYVLLSSFGALRLLRVNLATRGVTTLVDSLPLGVQQGASVALQLEPNALLVGIPGVVVRIAPR